MPRHHAGRHLLFPVLLLAPVLHPLLIPAVGAASHLLWWLHLLPVALTAFWHGPRATGLIIPASLVLLAAGERLFGMGYGQPASWDTTLSLAVALLGTHLLVAGFALYARRTTLRYQHLFDSAAAAILRVDEAGRILAVNPAALKMFGASFDRLERRRFEEVSWLRHLPPPRKLAQTGWSGRITTGQAGEESTLHVTAAAVGGEDPPGYQVLVFDRTREVVRDQELERQGRLAALGSSLSGVAHEMKNPLQVISAFSELALAEGSSPSERRDALETIHSQALRLNGLVQELLGFSRSDGGARRRPLGELVRDVVRMQRVANGMAVRIEERIPPDEGLQVSGPRVEQILVNLISNAIDAAPTGSGVVTVELTREGGDAVLTVSDNGPGIDPELADRIFEPFVSTKAAGKGTGLGLAICRRLAASMDARLTAGSGARGGAVFTLRIPTAPRRVAEDRASLPRPAPSRNGV